MASKTGAASETVNGYLLYGRIAGSVHYRIFLQRPDAVKIIGSL